MWQVCDTCGAIIFDFTLHAAWHATFTAAPHVHPDPAPTSHVRPDPTPVLTKEPV